MPTPILRSDAFCDHLTAAGCAVGVELHDGCHSIVVTGERRVLRAPVDGGFDLTATVIVLSGALRHQCTMLDVEHDGWVVRGEWPELDTLAPAA